MQKTKQLESVKNQLFKSKTLMKSDNMLAIKGGNSCPYKFTMTYWILPDGMDSRLRA